MLFFPGSAILLADLSAEYEGRNYHDKTHHLCHLRLRHPDRMRIVAGADCRPGRLALLREEYGVPEDRCFSSDQELLDQPKLADVMLIATQDRQHVPAALRALDKGYHILLEKPISPDLAECRRLLEKARETGKTVVVCHVLRYTPFYAALEALVRRGEIGRLATIDAVDHVGYWPTASSGATGGAPARPAP